MGLPGALSLRLNPTAPTGGRAPISARFGTEDTRKVPAVALPQDLGSTNGSTINGERVEPGCSYPLKTGDVLGLGDVVKVTGCMSWRRRVPGQPRCPAADRLLVCTQLAIRVIPGDPARMTVEEFARAQANLLEQKIHLAARKSKQELREQGLALKRAILSQLNH